MHRSTSFICMTSIPRQEVAQEDVETLADSIRTCGLLQNLGGIQDDDGKIGIVSGGRRLRALAYLAETSPDFEGANFDPGPSGT